MNILVVGGGGREHAIIKKIKQNPRVTEIYALPGNGGIEGDAICVGISAKDTSGIVDFAVKNKIDYAIVAPDDPLVLGTVDRLSEKGIPCFGPTAAAARIEGSKVFAKNLMEKYDIPTAECQIFESPADAIRYVMTSPLPTVVKADGLALGKGVFICETHTEAIEAVRSIMEQRIFGESGAKIVIEEYLTGPEVSVLTFTDGETVVPMISSMDHKRAGDDDKGPNTGGMGTVAPNPYYTEEIARECMEKIFLPTIRAMKNEGCPFSGCLYFGLMLTAKGPKVIEYNCRFGDPETQVTLPLMKSDLLTVMEAVTYGRLAQTPVEFTDGHACCVILASQGYPVKYEKGFEIKKSEPDGAEFFFAGAEQSDGKLVTSGGRVAGVTACAKTLSEAIAIAYREAKKISFTGCYMRHDIGKKALAAKTEE